MRNTCPGFTLIELLITISIMAVLFSLGFAQYMKFNRQQVVNQAVLELKTNLLNAQSMALAGKKTCQGSLDGVLVEFIDNKSYKMSSTCDNQTKFAQIGELYTLPQEIIMSGATENILFKVLTGGTNLTNDITITLEGFGGITAELTVTSAGKIEII